MEKDPREDATQQPKPITSTPEVSQNTNILTSQTSSLESKYKPEPISRPIKTEKSLTASDAVVNRILQRCKKPRIELIEVSADEGEDSIRILSESHEKSSNSSKSVLPSSTLTSSQSLPPSCPPDTPAVGTSDNPVIVEDPVSCVVFIKLLPVSVTEVEVWREISQKCPNAKPISMRVKSAGGTNMACLFFSTQEITVEFRRTFIQKYENKFLSDIENIIHEEFNTFSAPVETILNVESSVQRTDQESLETNQSCSETQHLDSESLHSDISQAEEAFDDNDQIVEGLNTQNIAKGNKF